MATSLTIPSHEPCNVALFEKLRSQHRTYSSSQLVPASLLAMILLDVRGLPHSPLCDIRPLTVGSARGVVGHWPARGGVYCCSEGLLLSEKSDSVAEGRGAR